MSSWSEINSVIAPRVAVLALIAVCAASVSLLPPAKESPIFPVNTELPDMVNGWRGKNIYFCHNSDCQVSFTSDAGINPTQCHACKSPVKQSWSLAEESGLPRETMLIKKMYISDTRSIQVSVVITGYERVGIHRPQMCLPAQGFSITGEDSISVPAGKAHLPARRLYIQHQLQPGISSRSYYWFTDGTHFTDSNFIRTILQSFDRLFGGRIARWAYIAVTPFPSAALTQADEEDFVTELYNRISEPEQHEEP